MIFFESQRVTITDQRTDSTVAHECAVNGLYKLANSTSDRAFISNDDRVRLIEAQASEVSRNCEDG